MTISAANLSATVTVWLARGGVSSTGIVTSAASPNQLWCPLISSSVDSVTCSVPAGHGIGWHVFVVNNDTNAPGDAHLAALRSASFQSSGPSGHTFSYSPPNITAGIVVSPFG